MDARLSDAVGYGECNIWMDVPCGGIGIGNSNSLGIPIQIIEPDMLFFRPQVPRADFLKRRVDALVAELHGLDGVRPEREACADFAEGRRLLIDGDGDGAVMERDG